MKRRRNAKRPSPVQAWYQATRKQGEADELFMQFVREGMTREELAALIERRPALWGRYSGFLSKLPSGKKNPRRYRRNSRMSRLAKQARKRVAIKRTLRRAGHRIPAGIMFKTGALRQYRRRKLGYNRSRSRKLRKVVWGGPRYGPAVYRASYVGGRELKTYPKYLGRGMYHPAAEAGLHAGYMSKKANSRKRRSRR